MDIIELYWHYWFIVTTATWIAFFSLFYLKNKYGSDKPSKFGKVLKSIFEYGLDMPCNWFLTFFPFFDLPDHVGELVTHRLKRYKAIEDRSPWEEYRYRLAVILCNILNKGDKDHC